MLEAFCSVWTPDGGGLADILYLIVSSSRSDDSSVRQTRRDIRRVSKTSKGGQNE